MSDTKKQPFRERKQEEDKQPIPFDEALRRLVNTPPKPKKSSGKGGPKKQRGKAPN